MITMQTIGYYNYMGEMERKRDVERLAKMLSTCKNSEGKVAASDYLSCCSKVRIDPKTITSSEMSYLESHLD